MNKRTLEELSLLDDFLFSTMINDKTVGDRFIRSLLRIILQKEFGQLKIVSQKFFIGNDTALHGTRLDVFVEEQNASENATVYDIEPELKNKKDQIEALPRRLRFYHAKIDADSLEAGADYGQLKNVCVIMIAPFDPFGLDRMIYTIQNRCTEDPDMPYDDGAKTLFLYTRGTKGNPPQALRELLHYMESTTETNAVNPSLKEIHGMVTQVKKSREVTLAFMKIFEKERMLIQEGIEQGIEQGHNDMKEEVEQARRRAEAAEEECRRRTEAAEAECIRLRRELARLKK